MGLTWDLQGNCNGLTWAEGMRWKDTIYIVIMDNKF